MRRCPPVALLVVTAALAVPASATTAPQASLLYRDTLPQSGAGQVTVTTRKAASFRVLLRVPTQGRARLYLLGKSAPRGGPLIDTKIYACEGAAGSRYCRGAYEPLARGTYTWRIVWKGAVAATVELTVRW